MWVLMFPDTKKLRNEILIDNQFETFVGNIDIEKKCKFFSKWKDFLLLLV